MFSLLLVRLVYPGMRPVGSPAMHYSSDLSIVSHTTTNLMEISYFIRAHYFIPTLDPNFFFLLSRPRTVDVHTVLFKVALKNFSSPHDFV